MIAYDHSFYSYVIPALVLSVGLIIWGGFRSKLWIRLC